MPLSDDIIRMRRATTGIQETLLQFGEVDFRLVDVGGQRSERKKWIHCFEDVSSIIFIASLAEYNLLLVEDQSVNRLGIFPVTNLCESRRQKVWSLHFSLGKSIPSHGNILQMNQSLCSPAS